MPSCARRGVSLKPDSAAARVLAIETAGRENELDRRHRPCPEETLPARAALLRWPPAAEKVPARRIFPASSPAHVVSVCRSRRALPAPQSPKTAG